VLNPKAVKMDIKWNRKWNRKRKPKRNELETKQSQETPKTLAFEKQCTGILCGGRSRKILVVGLLRTTRRRQGRRRQGGKESSRHAKAFK